MQLSKMPWPACISCLSYSRRHQVAAILGVPCVFSGDGQRQKQRQKQEQNSLSDCPPLAHSGLGSKRSRFHGFPSSPVSILSLQGLAVPQMALVGQSSTRNPFVVSYHQQTQAREVTGDLVSGLCLFSSSTPACNVHGRSSGLRCPTCC